VNATTGLTELIHAVLDGEASDSEARELELRLAADPAARAEFDEWQGLFQALREMPKEYAPEGWSPPSRPRCPPQSAPSAVRANLFASRRVLGYTSSRIPRNPASAMRRDPATDPTDQERLDEPAEQQILRHSQGLARRRHRSPPPRSSWPSSPSTSRSPRTSWAPVAPAQRYRAAPNGSEDVQAGAGSDARRNGRHRPAGRSRGRRAHRGAEDAERNGQMTAERNAR
jgi:hypothetical protein